jgi:heptosyltransferase-3
MMKMFEGVWKESPDRGKEPRFTPLESPAICGGDDMDGISNPYKKGGVKVPSFLTGFPFVPWENRHVQSTLVIHQGALGDFILALPALETLRKTFPQAKSIVIGYPRILELVEKRFYAERILSIDQRGMASFFLRGGTLDPSLSQLFGQFDLVAVFGRDEEGTLIGNLKRVCHGHILQINPFPSWGEKIHLTEYLLRQFSRYGFRISGLNPRLHLKESDQDWGRDFWRSRGLTAEERSRVIILHPGSGSKRKVWPLERFLSLAQILQDHLGSKILIVFGPAEGSEVERVFEKMDPQGFIRVKGLSLLELASVMEGCRLFIGNDSGISHMASALGIPTIAIFGPTDPRVWSPRGERVCVVRKEIPCSPCSRERFLQCIDPECMKRIETVEVLKGLEGLGIET